MTNNEVNYELPLTERQHELQPLMTLYGIIIAPSEIDDDFYTHMSWALKIARTLHPEQPIELRCHGNGGSAPAALAVADLIRADGNIDGILIGSASSAHSIVWAACNRRFVYPSAHIGIHQARSWGGYSESLYAETYVLEARRMKWFNKAVARIYADASSKDKHWWYKKLLAGNSAMLIYDSKTLIKKLGMARPIAEREVYSPAVRYLNVAQEEPAAENVPETILLTQEQVEKLLQEQPAETPTPVPEAKKKAGRPRKSKDA